jgi:hypothetical protein
MNQRILFEIFVFDEANFPREPKVGAIFMRIISFEIVRIIGFDSTTVKV